MKIKSLYEGMFSEKKKTTCDIIILLIAMVTSTVWFLVLMKTFRFGFSMADDVFIRDMLNHVTYESSGYSIYIKHGLGWILSRLYLYIPQVEWYAWLLIGLNSLSLVAIHYSIQKASKSLGAWVIANLLYILLLSSYAKQLVFSTYTEVAGLCGIAAICLFYVVRLDRSAVLRSILKGVVICGFAALSFALREDAFFELALYAVLVFFWRMYNDKAERKCLMFLAAGIVASIGVFYFEDQIAYARDGYEYVYSDIDVQTKSVDYYGFPSWEEHKDFYEQVGINEEDAVFLHQASYALADISREQFEEITNHTEQLAKATSSSGEKMDDGWRSFVDTFLKHDSQARNVLSYSVVIFVFIACIYVVTHKKGKQLIMPLLCVLIYVGLALYLCMKGRIPDRVVVILFNGFVCTISLWMIGTISQIDKARMVVGGLIVALLIAIPDLKDNTINNVRAYDFDKMVAAEKVRETYLSENADNYYFVSPYMWGTGGYAFCESTERMKNYSYIHGYMTYLPEHIEKLEINGYGKQNMLDSFIQDPKVFLIPKDTGIQTAIETYIEDNYSGKELYLVEYVADFPVYNVRDKETVQ